MSMQNTEISWVVKNENFHQKNFDILYIFCSNIRKVGIPLHAPVLLYKCGVCGGIHSWTCFSDVYRAFICHNVVYNSKTFHKCAFNSFNVFQINSKKWFTCYKIILFLRSIML